jgi:hypothetical protein
MMMRMTSGLSVLALAAMIQATPAQAQSGAMAKPMPMAKEKVYTGCVAAGAMAGSFTLTNAAEEAPMGAGAMAKDAMGKDTMGKGAMGKDAMGAMAAPHAMSIASTAVDLSKHVGHKVSVTVTEMGMTKPDSMAKPDGMAKPDSMAKPDAMTKPGAMAAPAAVMSVSSLRMIAATCSM